MAIPLTSVEAGLQPDSFQVGNYEDAAEGEQDSDAVWNAYYAVSAKCEYAQRFEEPNQRIDALAMLLQFGACFDQDVRFDWWFDQSAKTYFQRNIRDDLKDFSTSQCRRIAMLLLQHVRQGGSLENRLWYHRLEAENGGWITHIQMLLRDWSEADPYHWIRQTYWDRMTETRMPFTHLALQRYFLEHHRLPDAMDEQVPCYVSEVPLNSHVNQAV